MSKLYHRHLWLTAPTINYRCKQAGAGLAQNVKGWKGSFLGPSVQSVYHLLLAFYGAKALRVYPEWSRGWNSFKGNKHDLQVMAKILLITLYPSSWGVADTLPDVLIGMRAHGNHGLLEPKEAFGFPVYLFLLHCSSRDFFPSSSNCWTFVGLWWRTKWQKASEPTKDAVIRAKLVLGKQNWAKQFNSPQWARSNWELSFISLLPSSPVLSSWWTFSVVEIKTH